MTVLLSFVSWIFSLYRNTPADPALSGPQLSFSLSTFFSLIRGNIKILVIEKKNLNCRYQQPHKIKMTFKTESSKYWPIPASCCPLIGRVSWVKERFFSVVLAKEWSTPSGISTPAVTNYLTLGKLLVLSTRVALPVNVVHVIYTYLAGHFETNCGAICGLERQSWGRGPCSPPPGEAIQTSDFLPVV